MDNQKQKIVKALDLVDSRNSYVSMNYGKDIVDAWLKFNTIVDMLCFDINADRPGFETIKQVDSNFSKEEIDLINEVMVIFDNNVSNGNLNENCKMLYQSLFNEHYFENMFKDLIWKLASE